MEQAAEFAAPSCNQNLSIALDCVECGPRRNDATFAKVSSVGEDSEPALGLIGGEGNRQRSNSKLKRRTA